MIIQRPARLAAIGLVLVALACVRQTQPSAVVEIVGPTEGSSVPSEVLVQLRVTGARAVPADGARREGEGHHHLFVDTDPTPADSVIPRTQGVYHLGTGADTLRLVGLAPGPHRVIAAFAYGDHVPNPSVARDTVTFVVR